MASGIVDFLVAVPADETDALLHSAFNKKSIFVFKLAESATPIQSGIESFFDKRVILDKEIAHVQFNLEQDVSIKFNIGTEVYFVKTKLKRYLNRVYFEKNSKIVQLKRRKEPRYQIPKKWTQVASLGGIACQVQDISRSGIRFECLDTSVTLEVKRVVNIQFQIYKRGAIVADALVHFFLGRPGQSSLIGMEFQGLNEMTQDRIQAIIDDIIHFEDTPKF